MASNHDTKMRIAAELMAEMAAGSTDALFEFIDVFQDELERVVAGVLGALHRRDVASRPDEVGSLAVSAALIIFNRAGSWRADGALPWVWAYRSIRAEVVAAIGHPTVEFEPQVHGRSAAVPIGQRADVDLHDLADRFSPIAAWLAAVEVVANDRDQAVHLEYQVQKHLGDPSPANTVASIFDLTAANVRQIDRRVRTKLATAGTELL